MIKSIFGLLLLFGISSAEYIRDDSKEIVLDTSTHIIWQDNNETAGIVSKKTWTDAINYCENLDFADKTDWRLPNVNELYLLADRSRSGPAFTTTAFQNVSSIIADAKYWSSTSSGNIARYVEFNYGTSILDNKTLTVNVVCIRNEL